MLFAPKEMRKPEKRHEDLANYRDRLHDLAMSDTPDGGQLAKDKELDFLIFEGIVMGHVDGNSPNVVAIVDHVHKRMGRLEERDRAKNASKKE